MGTILFLCAYSFIVMLFCAGSSPFIDSMTVDSSVFFTIGRGMVAGKVPYLDLFDHKGWYIYFINYLGALISPNNTTGLFLIECCFAATNSILLYAISKPFITEKIKRLIFTLIMLCASLNYFTYEGGNMTEAYTLTFQLIAFFLVIRYYKSEQVKHSPTLMFTHGLCVGIVLGLRANMAAMWGAIAIVIAWRLLSHKEYKNFAANFFAGLAGIIVALAPPIIYGSLTGSLDAMFRDYILFNLLYTGSGSLITKIMSSYDTHFSIGRKMLRFTFITVFSNIVFCCLNCKRFIKVMFVLGWGFSFLAILISGRGHPHYFETLMPFLIPLVVLLINNVHVPISFIKFRRDSKAVDLFFSLHIRFSSEDKEKAESHKILRIVSLVALIFVITIHGNSYMSMSFSKTHKSLSAFISELKTRYEELKQNHDVHILSTGNRAIFYNKLNVIPHIKYFYAPGMPYNEYPFPLDEQVESILNNNNDIIVVNYVGRTENDNKLIFATHNYNYPYNEKIMQHMIQNYDLVLEDSERQMWIKKRKD